MDWSQNAFKRNPILFLDLLSDFLRCDLLFIFHILLILSFR